MFQEKPVIWENGKTININTLFPASLNLYATMANQINDKGQISGMAVIRSGPHKGDIHAFLATPVNENVGTSIADVTPTRPESNLPATVNKQLLLALRLGRFAQ